MRGRAFSRYYYPLKNHNVNLYIDDSKYSTKYIKILATTDDAGYYNFCYRTKNKSNYFIQLKGDSGNSSGFFLTNGKTQEINLVVGQ